MMSRLIVTSCLINPGEARDILDNEHLSLDDHKKEQIVNIASITESTGRNGISSL